MLGDQYELAQSESSIQEKLVETYSLWMERKADLLQGCCTDGLESKTIELEATRMFMNLRNVFEGFFMSGNHVVFFLGRSAPIHTMIYGGVLTRVEVMQFPKIQIPAPSINESLYVPMGSALRELLTTTREKFPGAIISIHEDHSRGGFKYTKLLGLLKDRLVNNIFIYSGPTYPYDFWRKDVCFGIKDEHFNRFMSALSQLYSANLFFEQFGMMPVFDSRRCVVQNHLMPPRATVVMAYNFFRDILSEI